jgi:hypothetical protein
MNTIHELIKSYTDQIADYEKLINKLTLDNEKFEKHLDPKQPICTKCKHNLHYYDGWHCICEMNDLDKECWINFDERDKKVLEEDKKILQDEIAALRAVISKIACNLGNGSVVSEEASLEFIQMLPDEVKLVVNGNKRELNLTQIAFRELFQGLKKLVESFEKYLN